MTGATSGAGTAYPSEHLSSPPVFSSCYSIFSFMCIFCPFSFGHCVVCRHWFTDSDYLFGIFKLFLIANTMNKQEIITLILAIHCVLDIYLRFKPISWKVSMATFDLSPCIATWKFPYGVSTSSSYKNVQSKY